MATAPLNGYSNSTESIAENRQKYAKYFDTDDNSSLTMDDFYSLLMAEMSNQDPMEPMSNTEFISQMASFTSLKNQQDALYYSNANYAQSLVGKSVTVAELTGTNMFTDTGIVTSMSLSGGNFEISVNGKSYSLSNIMEVHPVTGSDGSFATSLIGKKVTVSAMTKSGVIVEEGVVQRIEIKDNAITVIINDLAYNLSDVVKVENAGETTTDNTNTNDESADTGNNANNDTDTNNNVNTDTDYDNAPSNEVHDNEDDTETAILSDEENDDSSEALRDLFE